MGIKERIWEAQEWKVRQVDAAEHMEATSSFVMMVAIRADGRIMRFCDGFDSGSGGFAIFFNL